MIIKALILLLLVSNPLLLAKGDEDEFAEFDEFGQDDTIKTTFEQTHSTSTKQPLANLQETKNLNKPEDSIKPELENDSKGQEQSEKPELKLVNVPSFRHFKVDSYYIEIGFILSILLYLVNYFVGSAKNKAIALDWFEKSREALRAQFVLVGGSPTISKRPGKSIETPEEYLLALKKQKGIIQSSQSTFTLWNSGRLGMDGFLVEMNLLKRQDLFSMAINLIKGSRDTLTFRIQLGQDSYENFVFCITHRSLAGKMAREMVDINTFCPKRRVLQKFVIMSELSDVSSFLLDGPTLDFLQKYDRRINYIHITDRFCIDHAEDVSVMQKLASPRRMASFSFAFPRNREEMDDILSFTLFTVDRLRKFKLARDSKQKSEKNRQRITDHLQKAAFTMKQEAAQAKKEELRRQEKERIYNEDDPEKQRRWEKKEAKRDQKRNKMRVKQLRVKSM